MSFKDSDFTSSSSRSFEFFKIRVRSSNRPLRSVLPLFFVSILRRQIVTQFFIVKLFGSSNHPLRFVIPLFFVVVLHCQIVPQFFIVRSFLSLSLDHSSILRRQIVGSSLGLFFFKYQNWVLETWFCFLDLEIYVAFSVQLIQHKDSQSESLRLEF